MITIEDLLAPDSRWRKFASLPEMDPLTEGGALQEAQLLDVRFDALRSTAGLLFELRTALQLREANTGVLVARGVRELAWSLGGYSPRPRQAWAVLSSVVGTENRLFKTRLSGIYEQLDLVAESAAFFAGDVPGLERIPDYVSDDEATVRANLANWRSKFVPVRAVFLDPAPS